MSTRLTFPYFQERCQDHTIRKNPEPNNVICQHNNHSTTDQYFLRFLFQKRNIVEERRTGLPLLCEARIFQRRPPSEWNAICIARTIRWRF